MRELSLHILDIAQNSIAAKATRVEIAVSADTACNRLSISVADNGCGMSPEFLAKVADPFTTKRTTRKVGMGIPLFRQAAELAGGSFAIESQPGVGTTVRAEFALNHIDRMPLGDLAETMTALIAAAPQIDFTLCFRADGNAFEFDTGQIRETLEGVPIESYEILSYLREYMSEQIASSTGGISL